MSNILSVAGNNSKYKIENAKPAGGLAGFWHGLIMPITFLVSLLNSNVSIYEVNNNNGWYHFGLIVGFYAFAGNHINLYVGSTVM